MVDLDPALGQQLLDIAVRRLSRIYAGVHTRLDHNAGLILGTQVGQYTLHHALDSRGV